MTLHHNCINVFYKHFAIFSFLIFYSLYFAQVSAMIGNIRNMSNDMNSALVRQNQTLDRINAKAGSDITRVKMANERAAALMK